ncbi:MAG: pyruvate, phosphate dikinase [bacterium]
MADKRIYFFGERKADGNAGMKDLLGGKGANLAEMTNLGLPVPPGFTISTKMCNEYHAARGKMPAGLMDEVRRNLARVEKILDAQLGNPAKPLLVSVRSGAKQSMPGMMDTVLNLGLNDQTVEGLAKLTGNERFAWDSYRRFVQMYGDVVLGLKPADKKEIDPFEAIIEEKKHALGIHQDTDLKAEDLKDLVKRFQARIHERLGIVFPQDPLIQLQGAIQAVFRSWMNDRAIAYRKINKIPEGGGTAVNVQAMVFGNMGNDCATGVAFTRDPSTGERVFYGEYLTNAQGEDVVAGIRTPNPISALAKEMPAAFKELTRIYQTLEKHYRDMQDMEFTIQKGRLWMLQTRSGKRTGLASVRIASDMAAEKLITPEEAVQRVEPEQLEQVLVPIFEPKAKKAAVAGGRLVAKGLNAGPGAASGRAVFHAEDAEAWAAKGERVILVRIETSPDDIRGMKAAQGILTARGGMTSHAAVVARQMGKVCVAGCGELRIDYAKGEARSNSHVIREGDWISLDGTTGEVILGEVATHPSEVKQVLVTKTLKPEQSLLFQAYDRLLKWADKVRTLGVRTNADQPDQAAEAVAFGAEGIGLCRTEHMFFGPGKIEPMQEMILADSPEDRAKALAKLLPLQREDFAGIFRAMAGRPVTIRTLDPPLHEFLPHEPEQQAHIAKLVGVSVEKVHARVASLRESNPMLGHRGCRLGIVYPEITAMQARAIFEAALDVAAEGVKVRPEIMIPLVGHVNELALQEKIVRDVAAEVFAARKKKIAYLVGTMIELPRAALTADEIAGRAEFFSFGTNDLTQTTFGLSRDDAGVFLTHYVDRGILKADPFQTLDVGGVGKVIEIAVGLGRKTRPDLKIGICGEHGGDPDSVAFCHRTGLNYVSCAPGRVPIARLAAAHAALADAAKGAKSGAKKAAKKPSPTKAAAGKAKAVKRKAR